MMSEKSGASRDKLMTDAKLPTTMDRAIQCVHPNASPEHKAWHDELVLAKKCVIALIAERDSFQQEAESLRQQAERSASEVARLAARCEGLEEAVRLARDELVMLPASLGYGITTVRLLDTALSTPAPEGATKPKTDIRAELQQLVDRWGLSEIRTLAASLDNGTGVGS